MLFQKHIPNAPLNQYIDCIVYVEGNNKGVGFPKTAMSLVFNLNDSFKLFDDARFSRYTDYKKYWIAGLQTQPSYVESYGSSKMLVIQFKSIGAHAFLQQPLWYFTNGYTHLDAVLNNLAEEVWEQLQETETIEEKFQLAEKMLFRRIRTHTIPHGKMLASIEYMFTKSQPITVNYICREHAVSRKHLNFLCREYLGISPKMLSSLNRFQTILHSISKAHPGKLSGLAYELEFFDQAHFNNDFKRFTGLTPTTYIKNVEQMPSLKFMPHFLPVA
ncbi:MAG: helix-turn-helix domain-containing protein [Bacteroidetes bacterium]|nr:helix-turn-helix domain-containing protein [Bacteroidota bacterium]